MSLSLVQAQREIAELELSHTWLRKELAASGRREAAICEQRIARDLAELKRLVRTELAPNSGYVIYDKPTHKIFTGVPGDLWSTELRAAERFTTVKAAEAVLRPLRARCPRADRWRLTIEPLAKLENMRPKPAPAPLVSHAWDAPTLPAPASAEPPTHPTHSGA